MGRNLQTLGTALLAKEREKRNWPRYPIGVLGLVIIGFERGIGC
jgi:hypothetical protein